MDIYSFISSKDIAAYCRNTQHEFMSLEQAVTVYHSKKSFAERHKAWQEIIDTQPDIEVTEWTRAKRKQVCGFG